MLYKANNLNTISNTKQNKITRFNTEKTLEELAR